ncbi:TIGR03086 family metal-binding protein [Streptomyces sp. NPDC050439]|uniref:TIGR03086 family metal-binding protein n=1 Tax=unclassified Streptomyces TaxID=2593676 RepID=UPI00343AA1E5
MGSTRGGDDVSEHGTTNTNWAILDDAHAALRAAVRGVPAGDWERPTPCAEWNVTQVLQHAAGDQLGYASALTGGPGPEEDPFAPSGKLTDSPEALLEPALTAAAEAWAAVDEASQEVRVPLPPGTMTATLGVGACALDAAVHAWDLAVATGQGSPLTDELARPLLEVAHQIVEPLRAFAFAPQVEPSQNTEPESETAALLRYLGRNPTWP